MTEGELKSRTRNFAMDIFQLIEVLPQTRVGGIIAHQLGRSGSSVGANYWAACRARSPADFLSKLGVVLEETDESLFWLSLVKDSLNINNNQVNYLLKEANELISIFVTSRKTLTLKIKNLKSKI